MKINHDNYESILMDYLDGNLSDVERMDVDLFLQQNPEIAEQISDLSDVVLLSTDEITYDRKEELLTVTLPNKEFEQWENTQPKLLKEHISYPHKNKLFKLGTRRTPQWTWYAAACVALAVTFTFYSLQFTNENEIDELPIAVLPVVEEPIVVEDEMAANNDRWGVLHTPTSPNIAKNDRRDEPTCSSSPAFETAANEHLAIATISPITTLPAIATEVSTTLNHRTLNDIETTTSHPATPYLVPETSRREKLDLAVNNIVLDPLRMAVHTVTKRFFERKTDVELFLEDIEMPRFFAQR